MISRLFKRKPKKAAPAKKTVSKKTKRAAPSAKSPLYKKLLTAEGWKRLMMRRTSKSKK
jgi:hypothetical protein